MKSSLHAMNRRDFLKMSAGFAGAAGLLPYARMAQAAGPFDDYKALVCLFMYGGNDHHNTIIPLGGEYAAYKAARTTLAMSNRTDIAADVVTDSIFKRPLNAMNVSNTPGRNFAMHTSLRQISSLFNSGKAAVVANVGPMIQPTTRLQFVNSTVPLPPQLFSHYDQQVYWQTLNSDLNAFGWGGLMADAMARANVNGSTPLSVSISMAGTNPFLRGAVATPYGLSPWGPQKIDPYWSFDRGPNRPDPVAIFNDAIVASRVNKFEDVYGDILARTIDTESFLSAKLEAIPSFRSDFPGTAADGTIVDPAKPGLAPTVGNPQNGLADQLRFVARMIAARNALGVKRQLYFVSIGGFDSHGEEYETHAKLLSAVDSAVGAFQAKMDSLNIAQNVTLFTASDFGRTLLGNGQGSDHGWGGHYFVVGGAVQGGKFFGAPGSSNFPDVATGTSIDIGQGRSLPTISCDEYAATLGRWFGLSTDELKTALPNLVNFNQFANFNVGFLG